MVSSNDGWAVGYSGIILHWDGQTWSQVANPFPEDLTSVSAATPPDVWAGREHMTSCMETAGHGCGSRRHRLNRSGRWHMVSDDGWAVGYGGLILRYSPYLPVCRCYLAEHQRTTPSAATCAATHFREVGHEISHRFIRSLAVLALGGACGASAGPFRRRRASDFTRRSMAVLDADRDGALRLHAGRGRRVPGRCLGSRPGGTIMHWDGSLWRSVASPTTASLARSAWSLLPMAGLSANRA